MERHLAAAAAQLNRRERFVHPRILRRRGDRRLQTFFRIREPANPRQGARKDQLRVEVEAIGREHSARFRRRRVVVADGEKRRRRLHAGSDVTLVEGAGPLISGGGVGSRAWWTSSAAR